MTFGQIDCKWLICNLAPTEGDIGITNAAYNQRQNIEKSKKERGGNVVVSRTPVEKKKDKGKANAMPFSSSSYEKRKDTRNKTYEVALTDGGIAIQKAVRFSNPKEKHSDLRSETIEKSRNERESDVIDCHTSIVKRKDKGKAIAMPYSSSPTEKLKDTQNNVCNSSIGVGGPCQKGIGNLSFSSGSVENVKETNKEMLFYSHASGKAERRKANLNSSDGAALGKKSEKGKDIADTSCFLLEKINDKKKGILKRTRSSNVQIKEIGDEYLNPSTSSVGGSKDRAKYVNTSNSFTDKTKGQGKVILEPSNIGVSSVAMEVKSRPLRKNSEKNKNAAGVSSCPPMMRSKKLQ